MYRLSNLKVMPSKVLEKPMQSGRLWQQRGTECFQRLGNFINPISHDVFFYFHVSQYGVLFGQVVLLQEVQDEKAEELVKKCPVDVFDIEDIGPGESHLDIAPISRRS